MTTTSPNRPSTTRLPRSPAALSRAFLESVARLACYSIPGCDAAGVTISLAGEVTAAATEPPVLGVDPLEVGEDGDAGWAEALTGGEVVAVDRAALGAAGGRFRSITVDAGVAAALFAPIEHDGEVCGALSVFSRSPGAFGPDATDPAHLLAAQAAASVAAARAAAEHARLLADFRKAVESRDVIGQAKGILMAQGAGDADRAFEMLVRASQRENRKLREVARDVADRASRRRGE